MLSRSMPPAFMRAEPNGDRSMDDTCMLSTATESGGMNRVSSVVMEELTKAARVPGLGPDGPAPGWLVLLSPITAITLGPVPNQPSWVPATQTTPAATTKPASAAARIRGFLLAPALALFFFFFFARMTGISSSVPLAGLAGWPLRTIEDAFSGGAGGPLRAGELPTGGLG